jgi:hypothetical protein
MYGKVRIAVAGDPPFGSAIGVEMCQDCLAAVVTTMTGRFIEATRAENDNVAALVRQLGIEDYDRGPNVPGGAS